MSHDLVSLRGARILQIKATSLKGHACSPCRIDADFHASQAYAARNSFSDAISIWIGCHGDRKLILRLQSYRLLRPDNISGLLIFLLYNFLSSFTLRHFLQYTELLYTSTQTWFWSEEYRRWFHWMILWWLLLLDCIPTSSTRAIWRPKASFWWYFAWQPRCSSWPCGCGPNPVWSAKWLWKIVPELISARAYWILFADLVRGVLFGAGTKTSSFLSLLETFKVFSTLQCKGYLYSNVCGAPYLSESWRRSSYMEYSNKGYLRSCSGMRSIAYLLSQINKNFLPVCSNRKDIVLYRFFFDQTCYFTSTATNFRASSQTRRNILDMSFFDLVEFFVLHCLHFFDNFRLQANRKRLDSTSWSTD